MTTTDLIRKIDDVELPTPGRWGIAASSRCDCAPSACAGGRSPARCRWVTIAEDPSDSTLDLFISPGGAAGPSTTSPSTPR